MQCSEWQCILYFNFYKMIARVFWKLSQFFLFFVQFQGSNQGPYAPHVAPLPMEELSVFNVHSLPCRLFVCEYISYFQSLMDVQPLWRLMCTNKTWFAEVRTRPKTIFRIIICFLSYPCESPKIQTFLSADQTSIPGANQVFPVLEWNLIFVLLSKILDRLKRSFVIQIPRVTAYREIRNIHV